jgi:hypothetical protein
MNCTTCFKDNAPDAAVCTDCGSPLQPLATIPSPAPVPQPPASQPMWQPVTPPHVSPAGFVATASAPPIDPLLGSVPAHSARSATANGAGQPGVHVPVPVNIVVERSGRPLFEVAVDRFPAVIGRRDLDVNNMPVFPDVDLDEADPAVASSRRHAVLHMDGGTVYIEDVGSSNGTFVEGIGKLNTNQRQPLPRETRVMVGRGGPTLYIR